MITTNDQHEVKPFPFMHIPGFKSWRTAGLNVWKPYYLLSFACKEGRVWVSQAMALWSENDLKDFCMQAMDSPSLKIFQVTKLVPPAVGEVEMWSWVPIKEIWQQQDDGENDELYLIVNERNKFSHMPPNCRTKTRNMRKIFNATDAPSNPIASN